MAKKKTNKKTKLSLINYGSYNTPTFNERLGEDWVSCGEDNLYPEYLVELYNGSSINSAIINGVSAMVYGEGIHYEDEENINTKEQYVSLQTLLHNSPKGTLKNLAFDLKLFGACYVQVIYNKGRTRINKIMHLPAQTIRAGKMNDNGEVETYFYSGSWTNYRKAEYKPRAIPAFYSNDRTNPAQLLCIKGYNPTSFYYGLPDYQGSIDYIALDREISNFHLNNIQAGLFPSMLLSFNNGVPTEEERTIIERQIASKFSGSSNSGKVLLTFNDGTETKPTIEPINTNNNDGLYQYLSTEVSRKILTGHRVTSPLLFGVKGEGSGFGNNADELRDSYSLFNNTVIIPLQNTLLEGLEPVFRTNDINLNLYFKTLKPADFLDLNNEVEEVAETAEDVELSKEEVKKKLKALTDIDTTPTKGMIQEAKKGLEWRKEHKRGGTEIAVARARSIINGDLSIETIKRMYSFFSRHEVDKKAKGFKPGGEGYPSAGRIAWALWGGDPGYSWATKKVKEIDRLKALSKPNDKVQLHLIDVLSKGTEVKPSDWYELGELDTDENNEEIEGKLESFTNNYMQKYYSFADANIIPSRPDSQTSDSNAGLIRVLYRYSQLNSASVSKTGKSRPFCRQMVSLSKQGVLYNINDLKQASTLPANPGFGILSGSTYPIFQWKGGIYCYHKWIRKFYVRKRVPAGSSLTINGKVYKPGTYLPNGTLANFKESFLSEVKSGVFATSWAKIRAEEPKAPSPTIAPINTASRGRYTERL
tara:strand:- start:3244 stop:5523 length:2280 start_codon:yes stop_codon:yes gene_type:complete